MRRGCDLRPITPSVGGKLPQTIQPVDITGTVPLESWADIFHCFVGLVARRGSKSLQGA